MSRSSDVRKIALLRALYLGDMLLAVPAFRALRQRFPHAEITLIGLPWARTFVQRYHMYLDRLVEFPGFPGLCEVEVCQERTAAFCAAQRAYHYDLVLQMHGRGPASNLFVGELGGALSAGYYGQGEEESARRLSISIPYPEHQHEIYRNLGLAALMGCQALDPQLEFPLWKQDRAEIESLFQDSQHPWIGLHPGAKYASRRWPATYFAALADELARCLDAHIVLTGSASEQSIVQQVIRHMHTRPINLAGQTSLGGLAALIARLDLFVSNDTGPAHLAYALATPSITLFGPSDYQRWRPLEQKRHLTLRVPLVCSPCTYEFCPIDHGCLRGIDPYQVSALAERYLRKRRKFKEVGNEAFKDPHLACSW